MGNGTEDFFTIDDEGLYDEPIVHTVGEIARVPSLARIRMDYLLVGSTSRISLIY